MRRVVFLLCIVCAGNLYAQESFEEFRARLGGSFSDFKASIFQDYEQFKNKIKEDYCHMLKQAWTEMEAFSGIPIPCEKRIPPLVLPEEERDKPIDSKPHPIEEVIPIVKPQPQPTPIVPIEEKPLPVEKFFSFTFMGTSMKVRLDDTLKVRLKDISAECIVSFLDEVSNPAFDALLGDCLKLRKQYDLCDWAYLLLLRELSHSFYGISTDESVLMMAWLYGQSGYTMRLAVAEDGHLRLLFACHHSIFQRYYWEIDGNKYYALDYEGNRLSVCQASFPEEKPLSLYIHKAQQFAVAASSVRTLQSERYPEMVAQVTENMNKIAFYETYPTSMVNDDMGTRWAMYANVPLDDLSRQTLYPSLSDVLVGLSQKESVERLLNWVQTAFVYEYDDKVWGHDRAFFAEESLYYPYCDCEDRSILFSRLVRDLLDMEVVLIFYPGHLATAVHFTDTDVAGDYVIVNGKRYIICDPTYIGASVGATMPNMDNTTCKVILL